MTPNNDNRSRRIAEIHDTICIMREQESNTYRIQESNMPSPCIALEQHAAWRPIIVDWMYKLSHVVHLRQSTVAAAAYYLDAAVHHGIVTVENYQIVALTSLYVAIKLYEHKIFPIDELLALVRRQGNHVSREDVTDMEGRIIFALRFRLHPPTAHCFVQRYLDLFLLHSNIDSENDVESIRSDLEMAADYFVQEIVKNGGANYQPSVAAYAAMLIALGEYIEEARISNHSHRSFLAGVQELIGLDVNEPTLFWMLKLMSSSSSTASACLKHAPALNRKDATSSLGSSSPPPSRQQSPRQVRLV